MSLSSQGSFRRVTRPPTKASMRSHPKAPDALYSVTRHRCQHRQPRAHGRTPRAPTCLLLADEGVLVGWLIERASPKAPLTNKEMAELRRAPCRRTGAARRVSQQGAVAVGAARTASKVAYTRKKHFSTITSRHASQRRWRKQRFLTTYGRQPSLR